MKAGRALTFINILQRQDTKTRSWDDLNQKEQFQEAEGLFFISLLSLKRSWRNGKSQTQVRHSITEHFTQSFVHHPSSPTNHKIIHAPPSLIKPWRKRERARAGIEPTAAAPSQPDCPGVIRSDHSAGFKRIGSVTSFRATFGLTRSIGGWEEGERRERNKQKRQPGRTGAGQRGEWQLNEQREEINIDIVEREENTDVEVREKERVVWATNTWAVGLARRCRRRFDPRSRSFSPVWRQTGQAQKNGAQWLRTGPKWYTTCTSSRFFAKYTHFAIVFGGSAGRGTLLLWNGGWSIRLAALREELRRSKVRLEPWSSGHYRLLSRPGQAWEVLCVVWRCAGVYCSTRHACITRMCTCRALLAGHFSSEREHCKSCTGLVWFALSFAIGFRELVDQAADDCACASFQSWMC